MCVIVCIPLWCSALKDNVRTLDIEKSGSAFLENRRVYSTLRGRLLKMQQFQHESRRIELCRVWQQMRQEKRKKMEMF